MGSVSSEVVGELGLNYAEVGSLIGLFMVPGLFLAVPAGLAGNLMSDKFIIGIGLVALSLGGGLAGLAETFQCLSIARFICGIGFVISSIFFAKVTVDWFDGKELATAMSVLVMSWPFGIAMGQVSHGWLAVNFDWRAAFIVAAIYCAISALLIIMLYKAPSGITRTKPKFKLRLSRDEFLLTVVASMAWGFFNAGYVVYLSFSPLVLIFNGYDRIVALGIISIASWVMIASGALCGIASDKTGKPDGILYVCLSVCAAALLLLVFSQMNILAALLFGLIGMAPAGIIMSLSAKAMKPENRAIGMGVFFMGQVILQGAAPAIAGWLYDVTLDHTLPIFFAVALFVATGISNLVFRVAQRKVPL